MNRTTLARNGIAAGIAGLGLAVGGIAIASADTETSTTSTTSTSSTDRPGGHRGGPMGGHLGGQLAETLATELGLEQSVVEDALKAVMEDLRPERSATGERPAPPTEAERAERQAALAKALATELDVAQEKVAAALDVAREQADATRAEFRTQERADLVTRLDAAVTAGTLTAADKASVLKAFDAELIGGRGGHGGPMGRG